jgi:hypothetical protein
MRITAGNQSALPAPLKTDRDLLPIESEPTVVDFPDLSLMCFVLLICITDRGLTFRSTRMLRHSGRCSRPEESSPSHRSADFTTGTNDEPLEWRMNLSQHVVSPFAFSHYLFSFKSPAFQ